mgnify:CR=1 FL=1
MPWGHHPFLCRNCRHFGSVPLEDLSSSYLLCDISIIESFGLRELIPIIGEEFIEIIALDERVGSSHMSVPGYDGRKGYGGACFPKDIDALIHLAADPRTFLKNSEGDAQIQRNKKITNNLIEYLKDNKCKLFLYFSSCYVYSGNKNKILKENLKIKPIEALGKSKKNSERLLYKFSKISKQKMIILRLFSVYGKGAKETHYLLKLIKSFKNKIEKYIYINDPKIKRDYININDLITAIKKILTFKISKYKKNFYVFNVSTGNIITNQQVALCLKKILKSKKKVFYRKISKSKNHSFISSNVKFKKFYKWHPKIKFENGLKDLV